jgi:hypothetical protein
VDENCFAICVYLLGVFVCLAVEKAKINYAYDEGFVE